MQARTSLQNEWVKIGIPRKLDNLLSKHFPCVDFVLKDSLYWWAETSLLINTLNDPNPTHKTALSTIHEYRENSQCEITLADQILYEAVRITAQQQRQREQQQQQQQHPIKPITYFEITQHQRTYRHIRMPKNIAGIIEYARNKTALHSFATQGIFERLNFYSGENKAMNQFTNQEFIPASNETKFDDLQDELNKVKAKVTRIELQQAIPTASINLIGELLIQLINAATIEQIKQSKKSGGVDHDC